MYIESFFINGFGIFAAQSASGLENGLNVFLGQNEAGKTTSLEFLRTMLFGFPHRYAAYYPPLRGGVHGGHLVLKSKSAGFLHIERRPGKNGLLLTDERGVAVNSERLTRLMQGVTRRLYDNVYGFGLKELQDLDSLSNPEVQNALYGASFGLGARTVSEALTKLQKEMQDIFRAGGSTQPMAVRLKELETLGLELKQKRAGVEQYNELLEKREILHNQSEALREELDILEARRRILRRHLELKNTWQEYRELLQRLSLIPQSTAPFTTDSLKRLESLCSEKETYVLDLERITTRIERIHEELQCAHPQSGILENEERIQFLIEAKAVCLKQAEELPQCAAELEQIRAALQNTTTHLGLEFTRQRINGTDTSFVTLDRLERFDHALNDAENTLKTALERESLLENTMAEAEREEERATFELATCEGDVAWPDKARDILDKRGMINQCARSIPELRATVEHGRKELTRLFYELGDGWTPARVEHFDTSAAFRARLGELDRALVNARRLYDDATLVHSRAEFVWTGLKERLTTLEAAETGRGSRTFLPLLSGCCIVVGIILLVLGIVSGHGITLFTENRLAALVPGGALFLTGLMGFGVWGIRRVGRNNSREMHIRENLEAARREMELAQTRRNESEATLKTIEDDWLQCTGTVCPEVGLSTETMLDLVRAITALKGLNRELSPQVARLKELEVALTEYAQSLGCEPTPESVISALDRLDTAFRDWQTAQERQTRARQCLENSRAALHAAKENTLAARQALNALKDKWRQWLAELGLATDLLPSSARHVFAEIARAKELMVKENQLEQRLAMLKKEAQNLEDELDVLPGGTETKGENTARRIDRLAALLRDAKDAAVRQQEKAQTMDETLLLKEECSRRLTSVENALSCLLTGVGAPDTEHFRAAYETWLQRKELTAQCEELRARLETGAGEGGLAALQATLTRFEADQESNPETELQSLDQECTELAMRYRECLEEKGGVAAKLRDLEQQGDETKLHKEMAELQSELEELAQRWSALALARHFLLKAKEKYEIERQPVVMREAGELFARMTGGKYKGLVPTGTDMQLAVLSASGASVPCANLSRGTYEQLFLAMRMAYIQDHGRHAEPLPVIMDDILVNFDPERAQRTAESVAELAASQQVIFFTCHPRTAEMLSVFKHKAFKVENGIMRAQ